MASIVAVLLAVRVSAAQIINWDMPDAREVNRELSTLPVPDQEGIVRRLGANAADYRAIRISTGRGYLFAVRGMGNMCGNVNCAFWILDGSYKVLLHDIIEGFQVLPDIHQGRPDIFTRMHGSQLNPT